MQGHVSALSIPPPSPHILCPCRACAKPGIPCPQDSCLAVPAGPAFLSTATAPCYHTTKTCDKDAPRRPIAGISTKCAIIPMPFPSINDKSGSSHRFPPEAPENFPFHRAPSGYIRGSPLGRFSQGSPEAPHFFRTRLIPCRRYRTVTCPGCSGLFGSGKHGTFQEN